MEPHTGHIEPDTGQRPLTELSVFVSSLHYRTLALHSLWEEGLIFGSWFWMFLSTPCFGSIIKLSVIMSVRGKDVYLVAAQELRQGRGLRRTCPQGPTSSNCLPEVRSTMISHFQKISSSVAKVSHRSLCGTVQIPPHLIWWPIHWV